LHEQLGLRGGVVCRPLTLLPGWLKLPWKSLVRQSEVAKAPAAADERGKVEARAPVPAIPDDDGSDRPDCPESAVPTAAAPGEIAAASETTPIESGSPRLIGSILLLLYGLVVLVLLARLAIGQLTGNWRSGSQAPVEVRESFIVNANPAADRAAGSDRVTGPICFGVLRPRIAFQLSGSS
jgi:hypothetical protein